MVLSVSSVGSFGHDEAEHSFDAKHVMEKLRHLHLTERTEMHLNYLSMQRGLREDEDEHYLGWFSRERSIGWII